MALIWLPRNMVALLWPFMSLIVACVAVGIDLEFLSEPTSRLVKLSDGRAVFRCEVSPPSAEVRWLWKGRPVVQNRWIKVSKHKLIIHLAKMDKKAFEADVCFQCEARLKGRVLVSAPAELIVAVLEQFPAQDDLYITALKGNTVLIPCHPPHSVPTVITEFLFNNSVVISKSSGRRMIMPSGNLQILDAHAGDSGEYICIANNPYLSEKCEAKHKVILKVKEPERPESLHFIVSPRPKTSAVLGSNVTLECAASGYPVPSVIWKKQHGHLPHNRHQQVAGNLLLFGIHRGDEGVYICEAENTKGSRSSASTVLEVQETPQIIKPPRNEVLDSGQSVALQCMTQGHPKPVVSWVHNGKELLTESVGGHSGKTSELVLHNVSSRNAGIYQCFARNELGTVYASSLVTVTSESGSYDGDNENQDYDDYDIEDASHSRKPHKWKGNHPSSKKHHFGHNGPTDVLPTGSGAVGKRHRKKKKHKGVKLIPPSRPEVTRLSDTSVMVRWGVPRNDGLPILFFKVQYKEVGKKSTQWMTIDEDIAAHIHSYAVTDLKNGGKYRFRIAAVYSNNDNKLGPNSAKFVLYKDPPMKKPVVGPVITHAEAVSPSAIALYWEYEDLDSIPIEGFFIYYRTTHSAGDYLKVTVLGANTRSHIISHLLPDTAYDIKTQCFNIAGTSEFSNIYTCKTKPSENVGLRSQNSKSHHLDDEVSSLPATELVSSKDSEGNMTLNIVLGVISSAMLIAITIFLAIYVRQRMNRQQTAGDESSQETPVKIGNGHITNGYIPVNKVNISVNPLSELDSETSVKVDEHENVVSNNNEIIHMQTFNTNEAPHLEPLLAGEAKESTAGAGEETVILPGNADNSPDVPRSI